VHPGESFFTIDHRVAGPLRLPDALSDEGCNALEKTEDSEHRKFGRVIDRVGNKVGLWQPPEGQ
jgi:hypothetical protein